METLVDFQSNMDIRYLHGEKNNADAMSRQIASEPGLERLCTTFEVTTSDFPLCIVGLYEPDPYYSSAKLPV